ncbi:MAG: SRPBCC family protein [Myxococcota bacterium]
MVFALFTNLALGAEAVPDVDTPLPPIDPDSKMRIAQHEIVVDLPLEAFHAYWKSRTLDQLAVQTDKIPRVVRTEIMRGETWSGVGTRRRVFLSDGSTATEEILADELTHFRYQVFGYTSAAARFVQYGVGEFVLAPLDDRRTQVTWTYKFRPRTVLGQLFLGGWVARNWSPWMEGYLANLKSGAEATRVSEVPTP